MATKTKNDPKLGVILTTGVYPLKQFQELTGMGDDALRAARAQGLKVRQNGRRKVICGWEFEQFLTRQQAD